MRILAIEHDLAALPGAPAPSNLRDEAARVWDLMQLGIVRNVWFTIPDHRAVLMLECASESEAHQHLATLPLVRDGQIDFFLIELRNYDGFERLFAPDPQARHDPAVLEPAGPFPARGDAGGQAKLAQRKNSPARAHDVWGGTER